MAPRPKAAARPKRLLCDGPLAPAQSSRRDASDASESRAFYLLLEGRECSWSEVHHEVQSLCHVHFSNIYFTE